MNQLPCVLFDVNSGNADTLGMSLFINNSINISILAKRNIKLRDLIRLWKIGIKVIFTVHLADVIDAAMQSVAHTHGIVHNALVQGGQCSGHTGTNRAAIRIDHGAEGVFTAAVNFGLGVQLCMDLQAHNDFVFHVASPPYTTEATWHSPPRMVSNSLAMPSSFSSEKCGPMSCIPTGIS